MNDALSQIRGVRAGAISKAIEHQDAAGTSGAPLGVFRNDRLIERVPGGDRTGEVTRAQVAARLGMEAGDFEVLLTCPEHPQTAAVDCLVCVPELAAHALAKTVDETTPGGWPMTETHERPDRPQRVRRKVMADELAVRAYRSEMARLRVNAAREIADVRRHLETIAAWLADDKVLPQTRNLGTTIATLTEHVAALKALRDADYLVDSAVMRILVTTDNGQINGRRALIIEPATTEVFEELRAATNGDPDRVLIVHNARLHNAAEFGGTASIRAGDIVEIREA